MLMNRSSSEVVVVAWFIIDSKPVTERATGGFKILDCVVPVLRLEWLETQRASADPVPPARPV